MARNRLVVASLLVFGGLLSAAACGGRDQLSFGPGSDGLGGDDPVGPGSGGFGGFSSSVGGMGPTTTTGVGGQPTSSVTVTTTGAGGAPTTTGTGGFGPSSSSVTVGTTVTTVTTSGAGGSPTTSGVGGFGPASSSVGNGGFGGFPMTSGGGSNPLDCLTCIQGNCPQAAACFQNPTCLQGTICSVTQCLGNGPPNFGCVINCFNGDFMAAFQALQAVACVFQQCGQECQGLFGP